MKKLPGFSNVSGGVINIMLVSLSWISLAGCNTVSTYRMSSPIHYATLHGDMERV
jgi:hypothetical protein